MPLKTPRFFVSLDDQGRPLCQRTSLRERPYVAASYDGDRFSSVGPNGAYPRQVLEVSKAIEWMSYATLPDGTKVSASSKSQPIGRNYVRYSFTSNAGAQPERREVVVWTDESSAEAWLAKSPGSASLAYRVEAFALGTSELLNWPKALLDATRECVLAASEASR